MNAPEINFEATDCGFYGYFRKPSKADKIYVADDKGRPILFPTALAAHQEAAGAFLADRYGPGIRGESCAPTSVRAKADALFPKLEPSRPEIVRQSKTKRLVEVVRG